MIVGNPYKFSICIDTIKEWNIDRAFYNGVLFLCINGNLFPKKVVTATLSCEIPYLKKQFSNIAIDKQLYTMPKEEAFAEIYHITFPNHLNLDNDYRFDVSPLSFSDNHCFVFAVRNGEQVRILADALNYIVNDSIHELNNINVIETFITIDELNEIISNLDRILKV